MGIPDIISPLRISIIRGIRINPGGVMTGTAIKRMITMVGITIKKMIIMTGTAIMNTGIINTLKRVTEVSLTAVITAILTGMTIMTTVTMGTGIHGETGKDIIKCIRTDSITGDIIMMMTDIFSSGFAIRMAGHACSIQSAGDIREDWFMLR